MVGTVFDIKRFAVHDGPGIRTTVHLKGCHLCCEWCHNPEGIDPKPFLSVKNVKLGDRTFQQTEVIGQEYRADELVAILLKDRLFWEESGGGVAFSGGEPLLQFDFMMQVLPALKKMGIHTAVDTTCFVSNERLKQIAPYVDLFLIDLKIIDDELHKTYTGVSNQLILENIDWLVKENKKIRIRIPVIPDRNYNDESLNAFLSFLANKKIESVDLLPFHAIASAKYTRFGMENKMGKTPSLKKEELNEWKGKFEQANFKVTIGG